VADVGSLSLRLTTAGVRWADTEIKVDGKPVAVDAQAVLTGIAAGTHILEIGRQDYELWTQRVTVQNQQTTAVDVSLVPKPGRVVIRAVPSEIVVFLDGRAIRADEMKNGELPIPPGKMVTLVANANGYQSASKVFTLTPNERATWDVRLYPAEASAQYKSVFAPVVVSPPVSAGEALPPTRRAPGKLDFFELNQVDQRPTAVYQAKAVYPQALYRAGISGQVSVGFIVDPTGSVQNASVVNSTHQDFNAAALAAVDKWKFKPGMKNGQPVRTRLEVTIVFDPAAEATADPARTKEVPHAPEIFVPGSGPPAPLREPILERARPSLDYVWVAGYYGWRNGLYSWSAGHWELPPRPHMVWIAPHWDRKNNGYVFTEGFWR
jgi:TonB family protein